MMSLDNIKKEIEAMMLKIDAPNALLPTFGYSKDFGYPHIEVDSSGFLHYVINEKGQEMLRKTTNSLDELFYWVFSAITSGMAFNYELANREPDKDNRRIAFKNQIELLEKLDENWAIREQKRQDEILKISPFDDLTDSRILLYKKLIDEGLSFEDAWQQACSKYPLPNNMKSIIRDIKK